MAAEAARTRASSLAVMAIIPVLVGALAAVATSWLRSQPVDLGVQSSAASLLEFVRRGEVRAAYVVVRERVPTNQPTLFRDRQLTLGEEVLTTPLLLAAARGDDNMVAMLLTHAAPPEDRVRRSAICLAFGRGHEALARRLAAGQPESAPHCAAHEGRPMSLADAAVMLWGTTPAERVQHEAGVLNGTSQ